MPCGCAAILGMAVVFVLGRPEVSRAQAVPPLGNWIEPPAAVDWDGSTVSGVYRGRGRAVRAANLGKVLDELLPDTAQPRVSAVARDEVARLIEALGADQFRVREAASAQLLQMGEGIREQLALAAKSDNAERSWRAIRILRRWESEKYEDKSRLLPTLAAMCESITDDARLEEIAQRLRVALPNRIESDSRREAMRQCMIALLRSGKEPYNELLRPCLKSEDVQMAYLVVEAAGQAIDPTRGRAVPKLLLEAMQSDREDLALVAISFATNWGATVQDDELKRTLLAIFAGNRDNLKFQAAFPLMRLFHHPAAMDYVLEQAQSDDAARRCNAIAWLTADGNAPAEPSQRLLELLSKLLTHDDPQTRRMAAMALASFSGEAVVTRLIPLLGDKDQTVVGEVSNRLLGQSDRAMLRRLLQEAAKDDAKKAVRRMAQQTLEQLDQLERDAQDDDADDADGADGAPTGPVLDMAAPTTSRPIHAPRGR